MWDEYGTTRQATGDNITWRMRIACSLTKAAGTHSEYVMLIDFPQQWLRERASFLRYGTLPLLLKYINNVKR